jgi:hypothetical protein
MKSLMCLIKPHTYIHTHTHLLNYFLSVFSLFYIFLFLLFFFLYISFFCLVFPFLINKPQHFAILYFDADVDKRNLKIRKKQELCIKKVGMYTTRGVRQWRGGPEAESGMGLITREFFFHRENVLQREVVHNGTGVIISVGCA